MGNYAKSTEIFITQGFSFDLLNGEKIQGAEQLNTFRVIQSISITLWPIFIFQLFVFNPQPFKSNMKYNECLNCCLTLRESSVTLLSKAHGAIREPEHPFRE